MSKLNVAFLWHMHQPCYRIPDSRVFRLPWVRLHGLKDYYDMLSNALKFPEIKVSFNLVPGLLEQLQDYTEGRATDQHFIVSQKQPSDLSEEERCFILKDFFMAHWPNMVEPYPRYLALLEKRGRHFHPSALPKISQTFSDQELLDLMVWFNLCWIDPLHFKQRAELAKLKAKGKNFTLEDKDRLLDQQMDILRSIIPAYKKAWDQKSIEIATSPFYHPILPLLCDTQTARECMPGAPLPQRFSYPGDAQAQITSGLDYMEKLLGRRPSGLWPSEGSVSEKTVELIRQAGVKWMASDEKIWEQSLGKAGRNREDPGEAGQFYRSHIWDQADTTRLFFRDQQLSDLIGFAYYGWDGQAAARDLVGRLERKADALGSRAADHIVPVILDGENAWEAFPQDGQVFLDQLYQQLAQSPKLKCCTFSQYLEQDPEPGKMSRIFPGSWINHDFSIWIGQEEDNRAWNLLLAARQAIDRQKESVDPAVMPEITRELQIAEGSDWCWWYGGNFSSENLEDFDSLFRSHLQWIYQLLNVEAPRELFSPISLGKDLDILINQPIDLIVPKIDGRVSDFYEWAGAGSYNIRQDGGTMHRGQSLLEVVHFGFDQGNLYLRLDPHEKADITEIQALSINLEFQGQPVRTIQVKPGVPENGSAISSAYGKIIEIKLPFTAIEAKPGDTISFYVALVQNGLTVERHPIRSPISFKVPDGEFGANNWGA
ncbi:hypothetical protein HZA73_03240 [candidate division TA06 bacterium]|nr:hypothetical protein [candidate division TA06 bacterium]